MYVWSFLPDPMYLGQDHCATLETLIMMMRHQIQLYDLSESEGGNVDRFEDHRDEAEDDDTGDDKEGEDSEDDDGDDNVTGDNDAARDDDAAGDDG